MYPLKPTGKSDAHSWSASVRVCKNVPAHMCIARLKKKKMERVSLGRGGREIEKGKMDTESVLQS